MTEEIQNAIKNFEIYKEKVSEYTLTTALKVSDDGGEFLFGDFVHAAYDSSQNVCVGLDTIERIDRVIEFLKRCRGTTKKELKMCSCEKGFKMKIEDDKMLCAYCGKEIEEMIKQ